MLKYIACLHISGKVKMEPGTYMLNARIVVSIHIVTGAGFIRVLGFRF
jgi:hypothetical protein